MTKILIRKKSGNIVYFSIEDHSGFAEEGYDIVCSAISAVSQTTLIGIQEVLNIKVNFVIHDGFMEVDFSDNSAHEIEKSQVLLKTMLFGFNSMKISYGDFMRISEEEV